MDAAPVDTGTINGARSTVMAVSSPKGLPAYDIKDVGHTTTTHRPMDAALVDTGTTKGARSAAMAVLSPSGPLVDGDSRGIKGCHKVGG